LDSAPRADYLTADTPSHLSYADDDRGQLVRLQPSSQCLDHRNSILIWTLRRGQTI